MRAAMTSSIPQGSLEQFLFRRSHRTVMPRFRACEEISALILRSPRSGRLEGWPRARSLWPSFETALARLLRTRLRLFPEFVLAALTCAAFAGLATPSHAQAPDAQGLALKADATALCALVGKLQVIVFRYGYDPVTAEPRELEPYGVGYTRQRKVLLFGRQVKGYSKSTASGADGLPGWRNFRVDKIDKGVVNAQVSTFDPVRPAPDEHRYIAEFVCKNELVQ
jgi:hypothetical protein